MKNLKIARPDWDKLTVVTGIKTWLHQQRIFSEGKTP